MAADPFKNAEDEFFKLKGQLASGRITQQQFDAAIRASAIRDEQGRYWTFGGQGGQWYTYQGTAWVEANPYPDLAPRVPGPGTPPPPPVDLPERSAPRASQAAAPPAAQTKSRGGCGGCLITGCIAVIVLIVVVVGGGFLAFRSGAITVNSLLNLAGLGPANIEVDNFRDDAIEANIQQVEVSKDSTPLSGSLELNSFDVKSFTAQSAGKYRVEFVESSGGASLGACTLTVKGGDQYQFVALPERIVVNRSNSPSSAGADFVIDSSTLCR